MDIRSLAKIGKGTRRKYRDISLLDVSEEIEALHRSLQSIPRVAEVARLSPEMVREFILVNKLDPRVKLFIKNRLINSVDIAYRLSKLEKYEQFMLAKWAIKNNAASKDIRNIVIFRINNPQISLIEAINRVVQSKDRELFVAYLGIDREVFDELTNLPRRRKSEEAIIRSIFLRIVTRPFLADLDLNGRVVIIKVTKEGLAELRGKAKVLHVTLKRLANEVVDDYCRKQKPKG